jgi:hypothetical protein
MAQKVGDLYAELKLKKDNFKKGLTDSEKKVKNFRKVTQAVFAVAAAAAVYKFSEALKVAAKAASDLEEQTAKFKTVFRGSLEEANKSVENLTENFAMSTREAVQHMAAIQDLLVPMGLARDKAAGFSGEIVQLAADLGSFNNLPTEITMNKIKSALVGMYRPMRDLGVVLSATTVEQRALNMGLADSKDELTAADKALAAYKMIVEGSADAIGDMDRTHDSFANTMKGLNAQIEDFKATIGVYVIPALSFWADKLSTVIDFIDDLIDKTAQEPEGRTMIEVLKKQIVDLRMEQEKYQQFLERNKYTGLSYKDIHEKLAIAKESEAWAQEKLNKLLKNHKDIIYDIVKNKPPGAPEGALLPPPFEPQVLISDRKELEPILDTINNFVPATDDFAEALKMAEENAGELFGTMIQSGGNASAMLKRLIGQFLRMTLLQNIPFGGFLGGFMRVFGFQHGGMTNMPMMNMRPDLAVANENPSTPELVVPLEKFKDLIQVNVQGAATADILFDASKLPDDVKDKFVRDTIKPALSRDTRR